MLQLKNQRYSEKPELYISRNIFFLLMQVRDDFLNAIDNVLEADTDDLLTSQTESDSSTKYVSY